jgi:hypothetical protein
MTRQGTSLYTRIFFVWVRTVMDGLFGPERLELGMPRKLRVVEPGEEKPRVLSVAEAAALNDHRELLLALRDRIAQSIQATNVPAVALAALSRQLMIISKELSVLDSAGEDDVVGVAARIPDEAWSGV